jgi:hypothetical protein
VRDFGQSGLAAGTVVEVQIASKQAANTKPMNLDICLFLPLGRALPLKHSFLQ